jgi:sulfate transport system ATP-binding protein
MSILVENVSKKFGTTYALKNVNLEISSGSLTALVGPSGSGKSTLLRIIAGFETPEEGRVWLFGNDATKQTIENREIGFVFQNYALFPNLTVFENIAFGLKIKKLSTKDTTDRVRELLELIQLENFSETYPYQLSGGQRQRVALARAMAIEPKLLLLDEPFGALDPKVRKDLRNWLKTLHGQVPLTTLLVTHDQQEAMEVADQLVVFNQGQVAQFGTPKEIYDSPANNFIMNFIGQANKIHSDTPEQKKAVLEQENEKLLTEDSKENFTLYTRPHGYYLLEKSTEISPKKGVDVEIKKIVYGESLVKMDLLFTDNNEIFKYQLSRKSFEKLVERTIINPTVEETAFSNESLFLMKSEKKSLDNVIEKFLKKKFLLVKRI